MSDGGKASCEQDCSATRSDAGDYSRAIARSAVAQICETIGFEGFKESALDSLADIAIRYLGDLGKSSKYYANLSGRTQCNVFDVAQALEDLSLPQESIYTACKINSDAIQKIRDYVDTAGEIPFAQPLQQFPVIKAQITIPSFLQIGETPGFKHVPPWLPAFPDPHTYVHTPVWNERVSEPREDMIELARQHRKAERSLLSLQQRLLCNGSSVTPNCNTDNPILSKAGDGEREVSPTTVPAKLTLGTHVEKNVSLMDTFAPAIEAMKDGLGLDSGSDGERVNIENSDRDASLFLEFKGGKKVFGEPLDLRIRNKVSGKTGSWFGRGDERDDKKRRVEFILRQSLENQQEPPQL